MTPLGTEGQSISTCRRVLRRAHTCRTSATRRRDRVRPARVPRLSLKCPCLHGQMELIFSLLQASRCRHTAPPGDRAQKPDAARRTRSSSRQRKTVSRQCQDAAATPQHHDHRRRCSLSGEHSRGCADSRSRRRRWRSQRAGALLGQRGPVEGDLQHCSSA